MPKRGGMGWSRPCCRSFIVATFRNETLVSVIRRHRGSDGCWKDPEDETERFR